MRVGAEENHRLVSAGRRVIDDSRDAMRLADLLMAQYPALAVGQDP
jgi:hypothetical protein